MIFSYHKPASWLIVAAASPILVFATGCSSYWQRVESLYQPPAPPAQLGTISDGIWQNQERNGEASDFVIYQHEFDMDSPRLNMAGQDHVKQIVARLNSGHNQPVLVERSMMSSRPDTEFGYPVHPNPELDMQRREMVVRCLAAMGVADADQRVVVAPALAEGYKATEARQAYLQGFRQDRFGGYGHGGYLGGGLSGPFTGIGGFR